MNKPLVAQFLERSRNKPYPFERKPKPKRLPARKSMTIALGLSCENGIVLAADSQESYGYAKTSHDKVLNYGVRVWNEADPPQNHRLLAVASSGAGWGSHIDSLSLALRQELIATTVSSYEKKSPADLHKVDDELQRALHAFYAEHVLPFAAFPENERPSASVLLAADFETEQRLWVTEYTTINRVAFPAHAELGIGAPHAKTLLNKYWDAAWDLDASILMAIYAIQQVKESVDGCGISTSVAYLTGGYSYRVDQRLIGEAELLMRDYWDCESSMMGYVFAADGNTMLHAARSLADIRRQFSGLIKRLRDHRSAELQESMQRRFGRTKA